VQEPCNTNVAEELVGMELISCPPEASPKLLLLLLLLLLLEAMLRNPAKLCSSRG
jgi:hypothetical protein